LEHLYSKNGKKWKVISITFQTSQNNKITKILLKHCWSYAIVQAVIEGRQELLLKLLYGSLQ
jgi:hypothetical protein